MLMGYASSSARVRKTPATAVPTLTQLEKMAARFAPTSLRVETANLSVLDRQALAKLVEAARIFDQLFLKQLWGGNPELYARLQKAKTPLGKARLRYFWINKGPWSDLDDYKTFLPAVPARKPLGSNFYPEDMAKQDFERWAATLSPEEQERAKGFFTVIRWTDKKARSFTLIPYSDEYKDELAQVADRPVRDVQRRTLRV